MGQLTHGINGPVKGKVGAIIGSSWKGIPYVKGPYKKRNHTVCIWVLLKVKGK